MSYFFRVLRYPITFLFIVVGMVFYSKAHAAVAVGDCFYDENSGASGTNFMSQRSITNVTESACFALNPANKEFFSSDVKYKVIYDSCVMSQVSNAKVCTGKRQYYYKSSDGNFKPDGLPQSREFIFFRKTGEQSEPCETPKTDDQCNKGKTATITGNDIFWATGNYKGCTFTAADGVFIKLADGSMTGDATSTGSTGKSWCETTDSSYNPADDEALSKNPAFSPAKDNDPKNCKNGWVQAGGGKFHCLNDTSGNVDAPPDKVNPEDGSINSDKDGKPKPPDAGVGKPPTGGTDPDGGGGTGPDGGGGDCEGEDCEGGGGGTKPPARPADPWADILDAADVARVKADTQSVQDELADFYRSAASGFQININKPAAGAMPSYGDITQGGQKISLSMSWLDKISFADGRAGVLVLCSLIAAYIILVRR